jgi:hypothetical protein
MCWHKWTKWQQYEVKMKSRLHREWNAKDFTFVEIWQKRKCEKCGYEQMTRLMPGKEVY